METDNLFVKDKDNKTIRNPVKVIINSLKGKIEKEIKSIKEIELSYECNINKIYYTNPSYNTYTITTNNLIVILIAYSEEYLLKVMFPLHIDQMINYKDDKGNNIFHISILFDNKNSILRYPITKLLVNSFLNNGYSLKKLIEDKNNDGATPFAMLYYDNAFHLFPKGILDKITNITGIKPKIFQNINSSRKEISRNIIDNKINVIENLSISNNLIQSFTKTTIRKIYCIKEHNEIDFPNCIFNTISSIIEFDKLKNYSKLFIELKDETLRIISNLKNEINNALSSGEKLFYNNLIIRKGKYGSRKITEDAYNQLWNFINLQTKEIIKFILEKYKYDFTSILIGKKTEFIQKLYEAQIKTENNIYQYEFIKEYSLILNYIENCLYHINNSDKLKLEKYYNNLENFFRMEFHEFNKNSKKKNILYLLIEKKLEVVCDYIIIVAKELNKTNFKKDTLIRKFYKIVEYDYIYDTYTNKFYKNFETKHIYASSCENYLLYLVYTNNIALLENEFKTNPNLIKDQNLFENIKDSNNNNILHIAALFCHEEVILLLLQFFNKNLYILKKLLVSRNNQGTVPIGMFAYGKSFDSVKDIIFNLIDKDLLDLDIYLNNKIGIDIDCKDALKNIGGYSILHVAILENSISIVTKLAEKGANFLLPAMNPMNHMRSPKILNSMASECPIEQKNIKNSISKIINEVILDQKNRDEESSGNSGDDGTTGKKLSSANIWLSVYNDIKNSTSLVEQMPYRCIPIFHFVPFQEGMYNNISKKYVTLNLLKQNKCLTNSTLKKINKYLKYLIERHHHKIDKNISEEDLKKTIDNQQTEIKSINSWTVNANSEIKSLNDIIKGNSSLHNDLKNNSKFFEDYMQLLKKTNTEKFEDRILNGYLKFSNQDKTINNFWDGVDLISELIKSDKDITSNIEELIRYRYPFISASKTLQDAIKHIRIQNHNEQDKDFVYDKNISHINSEINMKNRLIGLLYLIKESTEINDDKEYNLIQKLENGSIIDTNTLKISSNTEKKFEVIYSSQISHSQIELIIPVYNINPANEERFKSTYGLNSPYNFKNPTHNVISKNPNISLPFNKVSINSGDTNIYYQSIELAFNNLCKKYLQDNWNQPKAFQCFKNKDGTLNIKIFNFITTNKFTKNIIKAPSKLSNPQEKTNDLNINHEIEVQKLDNDRYQKMKSVQVNFEENNNSEEMYDLLLDNSSASNFMAINDYNSIQVQCSRNNLTDLNGVSQMLDEE